jgi:hypothetical protein
VYVFFYFIACVLLILVQLAQFAGRDQHLHDALALEMLWGVIMGPDVPRGHPEHMALRSGMRLSCRNGFNFFEVRRLYPAFIGHYS